MSEIIAVPFPDHPRFKDRTSQRFGKLTAVAYAGADADGHGRWWCRCDCGNITLARMYDDQKRDRVKRSCGCMNHKSPPNKTHGETGTRLFSVWNNMRRRCSDTKNRQFCDYGGRGIKVCEAWKSFIAFRDWATANGYTDGLQIDRIDNDGNYEPGNCRFVTMFVQANNKRNNVRISAFGETKTSSQWAADARCVVTQAVILYRIRKGWDAVKAITTPCCPGGWGTSRSRVRIG